MKCIAKCHLKLKAYPKAHEYITKGITYSTTLKGPQSYPTAILVREKAKICAEEGDYAQAVELTEKAIGTSGRM